jgi:hypothetical protein
MLNVSIFGYMADMPYVWDMLKHRGNLMPFHTFIVITVACILVHQVPTSTVLSVPVWLDPKQQDVAAAGNSSLLAPIFLAQEVCSHPAMLPVHASQLSILPAKFNTHQVQ